MAVLYIPLVYRMVLGLCIEAIDKALIGEEDASHRALAMQLVIKARAMNV
jgi:hypothetical protein